MEPQPPTPSPACRDPSARGRSRTRVRPPGRGAALLAGCLLVAAAAAVGLDQVLDRAARRAPPEPFDVEAAVERFKNGPGRILWDPPLAVGSPAPDFLLLEVHDGQAVRLSGLRGRPVLLVFGSFGCDLLCADLGELARLHARYRDDAQFLFVYIQEAPHANPALPPPAGFTQGTELAQAQRERIRLGLAQYGLTMPCLDGRNSAVVSAYDAYPRRLVVVDPEGRIAHDTRRSIGRRWDLQAVEDCLTRLAHPHRLDAQR
jgi:hypothetical protein